MRYEEKMMQPFYKIGKWIASKMVKKEDVKYQKLEQTLQFVENSAKEKDAFEFTARRIAKVMMILFWGTGLCFLAAVFTGEAKEITFLARPSYGQGSMETDLEVQVEGEGEAQKIQILLQERQYSDQQIDEFFQQAIEDLESVILGENISMQEVRSSLEFPSSVLDGKVKADWFTDDLGLIDEKGNLVGEPAEGGTQVQITVNFSCQDREMDYRFSVCVFPPVRSEEEKQQKQIRELLQSEEQKRVQEEQLRLPGEIEGKKLEWKKEKESPVQMIAVLVVITALCIWMLEEERLQAAVKKKQTALTMEYASFLYKLMALLRAGLTIRGAFERLAQSRQVREHYIDEEIRRCCNEMKSGVPEAQAYENFGRRCQLPEYIKMGTILAQNLRKGSDGLADLLEAEALRGMEERHQLARKLGEQAGTKLLFPMMLMFGVVLIILMAPALMSFSF